MKYIDSDGQELEVEIDSIGHLHYYNSKNQHHRLDGPAIDCSGWRKIWCKEGRVHRIGGPAVYGINYKFSNYVYYINDKPVNVYYICG